MCSYLFYFHLTFILPGKAQWDLKSPLQGSPHQDKQQYTLIHHLCSVWSNWQFQLCCQSSFPQHCPHILQVETKPASLLWQTQQRSHSFIHSFHIFTQWLLRHTHTGWSACLMHTSLQISRNYFAQKWQHFSNRFIFKSSDCACSQLQLTAAAYHRLSQRHPEPYSDVLITQTREELTKGHTDHRVKCLWPTPWESFQPCLLDQLRPVTRLDSPSPNNAYLKLIPAPSTHLQIVFR